MRTSQSLDGATGRAAGALEGARSVSRWRVTFESTVTVSCTSRASASGRQVPRDEKRERTYRDEEAADAVAPAEPLLGEEAQPGVVAGEGDLVRRRAASIRRRELPQPRVDVLECRRAGRLLGEVEEGVDESRVRPGREGFEARKGDGRRLRDSRVR